MSAGFLPLPIAVDAGRIAGGTGVSHYGEAVDAALRSVAHLHHIVAERPAVPRARIRRWIDAAPAAPRPLRLRAAEEAAGVARFIGDDIFRQAQIHLDLRGRCLELAAPGPPGIAHWTYPLPLAIRGWTNIYTVHDLIPLTDPGASPVDPKRYHRLLGAVSHRADGIITVSDASAEAIAESRLFPNTPIENCGAAVMVAATPSHRSRDYLLVCGSIEPRKNIARIAEAYTQSGVALPLRIVGPDGWQTETIKRQADAAATIEWRPYLDRAALIEQIAGARALLMPSLAEGFGLPVLEAMSLGTPVITSDRGALAELAGKAALLADPEDVNSIACAIAAICRDDRLAERLVLRGGERAADLSLERFAERLRRCYTRIALGGGAE